MELVHPEKLYEKIIPRNPFKIKRRWADRLWSEIIRLRDGYKCKRCGHQHAPNSKGLQCSQFFSRTREATRFEWDNCDALCMACHLLWSRGAGWQKYGNWKMHTLGFFRYRRLAALAAVPNNIKEFNDKPKLKTFKQELKNNASHKASVVNKNFIDANQIL